MHKFTIKFVFSQMPLAVVYYFIGSCLGTIIGFALFFLYKRFLIFLLEVWFRRITIGIRLLNGYYTLWFILNNLVALMLVIVMSVFIFTSVLKSRRAKRFDFLEHHKPKITLYSAYMIPIGALMINGFLVNLFLTYTLFTYGVEKTTAAVILMIPHGINEFVALLFASSLGLAYLNILSPIIRRKQFGKALTLGKSLLFSNTTFVFIALIALLVVFSGFVEGILSYFVVP